MGRGFDIIAGSPKPQKKNRSKSHGKKRIGSSFFSWILIIIVIIIIYSFLNSNKSITTNPPESSISNDKLANSLEDSENSKKITPQVSSNAESPVNPSNDLKNATAENQITKDSTQQINSTNTAQNTLNKMELKIKILNGSGKSGIAASAKDKLEQNGYVVAETGTAKNLYNTTFVYYRQDKAEAVQEISQALNIEIKSEENNDLVRNYDLLIVLGKNYAQ